MFRRRRRGGDPVQLRQDLRRQRQPSGGQVLTDVGDRRSAGDQQDVGFTSVRFHFDLENVAGLFTSHIKSRILCTHYFNIIAHFFELLCGLYRLALVGGFLSRRSVAQADVVTCALSGLGKTAPANPGCRSPARFALGYSLSPCRGCQEDGFTASRTSPINPPARQRFPGGFVALRRRGLCTLRYSCRDGYLR